MKVQIFGQRELDTWIREGGDTCSHLLSIVNPEAARLRTGEEARMPPLFRKHFQKICRFRYYDVERKDQLNVNQKKRIPEKRDVRRAINFFRRTREKADGYTIHCWRGISRSAGIALGYLYLIHGDEGRAPKELLKIRPLAVPHRGTVGFFDDLLGSHLSPYAENFYQRSLEEMKAAFMEEIENGDALLEELESLDEA